MPEKGRLKLFGCGSTGRHAVVRLDRAASAANAAFDDLQRGDAADITGPQDAADGLRVTAETTIVRRAPRR
jgi:hypothetical protein